LDQNKVPGEILALALGGKMTKNIKLFIGLAVVGILVYWIAKSKNPAIPFGASAPVAPSVPSNVRYMGLETTPKLMQN